MNYTVRILVNAQRDLVNIEKYYSEHIPHESERCMDAIEASLEWIRSHAHQPTVRRFELRHVSTKTFRYYVWYRLFEDERFVQIIAILHHRRGDEAIAERVSNTLRDDRTPGVTHSE